MRGLDGYPVRFRLARSSSADLHHSPSRATNPEGLRVNRDLVLRERLHEDVRGHVFSGAILHVNVPVGNGLTNKVESDVDVFRACVVIVIGGKAECSLVVAIENDR